MRCQRLICRQEAEFHATVYFWNGGRKESEHLCADCCERLRAWGLNAPSVRAFSATPLKKPTGHFGTAA
jgi:hypothetical protein